jgi:hypothetical protein
MDSSAEDLVARYASRWGIEQASAHARQITGVGEAAIGHAVGSSQVSTLEDRLTVLEAIAADDAGRTRARTLRDAVLTARTRLHGLLTAGVVDTFQRDLDAVAAELERALETPQPAW